MINIEINEHMKKLYDSIRPLLEINFSDETTNLLMASIDTLIVEAYLQGKEEK